MLGPTPNKVSVGFYLFGVMEILNRIGNKICFRDLEMSKDVIMPLHGEISCQFILLFAGIRKAAGSEKEDMSSTWWVRQCSRSSGQR